MFFYNKKERGDVSFPRMTLKVLKKLGQGDSQVDYFLRVTEKHFHYEGSAALPRRGNYSVRPLVGLLLYALRTRYFIG